MQTSPDQSAGEAVAGAYRAHLRAMTDGDTAALDGMLDDGFTRGSRVMRLTPAALHPPGMRRPPGR